MIAQLRGRIVAVEDEALVIDVHGVGYHVQVPVGVIADATIGEELTLKTHLVVRETELSLYGAPDTRSMTLFAMLLSVSGVGPKAAMAMLSALDAQRLAEAIVHEDLEALTSVHGIGRKTAQRVVLDLKPKIEEEMSDAVLGGAGATSSQGGTVPGSGADMDAVAALTSLGYSASEARAALRSAEVAEGASVEERVTAALRQIGGA